MFKTPELGLINILGNEMKIEIDSAMCDNLGADAFFNVASESITLREEYCNQHRFMVCLTHESIHAIFHELGAQLPIELEEIYVNTISKTLSSLVLALYASNICSAIPEDTGCDTEEPQDSEEPPEIPRCSAHSL